MNSDDVAFRFFVVSLLSTGIIFLRVAFLFIYVGSLTVGYIITRFAELAPLVVII